MRTTWIALVSLLLRRGVLTDEDVGAVYAACQEAAEEFSASECAAKADFGRSCLEDLARMFAGVDGVSRHHALRPAAAGRPARDARPGVPGPTCDGRRPRTARPEPRDGGEASLPDGFVAAVLATLAAAAEGVAGMGQLRSLAAGFAADRSRSDLAALQAAIQGLVRRHDRRAEALGHAGARDEAARERRTAEALEAADLAIDDALDRNAGPAGWTE